MGNEEKFTATASRNLDEFTLLMKALSSLFHNDYNLIAIIVI